MRNVSIQDSRLPVQDLIDFQNPSMFVENLTDSEHRLAEDDPISDFQYTNSRIESKRQPSHD